MVCGPQSPVSGLTQASISTTSYARHTEPIVDDTFTKKQIDAARNGSTPTASSNGATRKRATKSRQLDVFLSNLPAEVTAIELVGWRCERVAHE
jgi:hypothetical protein